MFPESVQLCDEELGGTNDNDVLLDLLFEYNVADQADDQTFASSSQQFENAAQIVLDTDLNTLGSGYLIIKRRQLVFRIFHIIIHK